MSDLTDSKLTDKLVRGFDKVFHPAHIVGDINFVFGSECFTFSENEHITSNTLSSAIVNSIPHYLYVGSSDINPEHVTTREFLGQLPKEETPTQPPPSRHLVGASLWAGMSWKLRREKN